MYAKKHNFGVVLLWVVTCFNFCVHTECHVHARFPWINPKLCMCCVFGLNIFLFLSGSIHRAELLLKTCLTKFLPPAVCLMSKYQSVFGRIAGSLYEFFTCAARVYAWRVCVLSLWSRLQFMLNFDFHQIFLCVCVHTCHCVSLCCSSLWWWSVSLLQPTLYRQRRRLWRNRHVWR